MVLLFCITALSVSVYQPLRRFGDIEIINTVNTDGDVFKEWQELYVYGFHPYISAITNVDEEGDYGTDLLNLDTEMDTPNDKEEVHTYGTFLLDTDTDGEGMSPKKPATMWMHHPSSHPYPQTISLWSSPVLSTLLPSLSVLDFSSVPPPLTSGSPGEDVEVTRHDQIKLVGELLSWNLIR